MKKLLLIITLMSLAALAARARDSRYPYVVEIKSRADIQLSDSAFYKIARSVVFPVNIWTLPENNEFYRELIDHVIPEANARGLMLEAISIRGAASPEGPLAWNRFLGKHRMLTLFNIIDSKMLKPSCMDCLYQEDVPEDYVYLLRMMKEANDPDYELVRAVVVRYLDDDVVELKRRLQTYNRGILWRRLLKEYYPELRAARVVLFFRNPDNALDGPTIVPTVSDSATVRFEQPNLPLLDDGMQLPVTDLTSLRYRRELFSVKSNLLFDFAYMPFGYKDFCPIPNVAVEFYPLHGHFTLGAMFDCPWWQGGTYNHKYFQVRNYTLESRYYFRSGDIRKRLPGHGAAFKGWYLQAYAHAFLYGIGWADRKGFDGPGTVGGHGWQGEGFGGGLGLGYVLPLGRYEHWRLEFGLQVGAFVSKYDPYIYGCPVEEVNDGLYYYIWYRDPDEFKKRQYRMTWFGPTRVGIQLSYDLLYRKRPTKQGGATFKAKEGGRRR